MARIHCDKHLAVSGDQEPWKILFKGSVRMLHVNSSPQTAQAQPALSQFAECLYFRPAHPRQATAGAALDYIA